MDWLELHIDTAHAGLETVEAALSALGIDGVVIDDETEFQDFLKENRQYWDYVDENLSAAMAGKSRITFYLPADETGFSQLGQIRLALEQLNKNAENYEQRVKRHAFYERCGLTDLPYKIKEGTVVYSIMGTGETVEPEEYREMMDDFLGGFFTRLIDTRILKE